MRSTPAAPPKPPDRNLRIAIIDESAVRCVLIEEGLREAGYVDIIRIEEMQGLLAALVTADPDLIIIDLENSSRDVLEQMFVVSRAVRRPVAMFVDPADAGMMQVAVDAGVSAYVVDGFDKRRIRPILDMCVTLFNAFMHLQQELEDAKLRLAEKEVVDRAKLIIMRLRNIPEDKAYAMLRSKAMNEKKRIAEVARAVITSADLLG